MKSKHNVLIYNNDDDDADSPDISHHDPDHIHDYYYYLFLYFRSDGYKIFIIACKNVKNSKLLKMELFIKG